MTMGLLKSVSDVPGIDFYDYRDIAYWSKYTYRARIKFHGIRYVYWANTIDEWVTRMKTGRMSRGNGPLSQADIDILVDRKAIIENFITLRNEQRKLKKYGIRIEHDTGAVFSNDLDFLQKIRTWHPDICVDITEVKTSEYSGVKQFVNEPKSKYRVYLKSKRVDERIPKDLGDLLNRYTALKPSNSLKNWVKLEPRHAWKNRYCSSSYSIDYDEESTLSYLALMHGDILGKKYKLEKRPEAE